LVGSALPNFVKIGQRIPEILVTQQML